MNSEKYFITGVQYLEAAKVILEEIIKHKNTTIVISNSPISNEELTKKTQYSDQRLILPILFNFYHGIELMIKGFLKMKNFSLDNHESSVMVSKLYLLYPNDKNLIDMFQKHIYTPYEFINKYMQDNNIISMTKFYESLRYPQDKAGSLFEHFPLKHNHEEGIKIFQDIVNDIEKIIEESARTFHKYEK